MSKNHFYKVYIWGAGTYGKQTLEYVFAVNSSIGTRMIQIEGIIDSNERLTGSEINGYRIFLPEILRESDIDIRIVVAVKNDTKIREWIKRNAPERIIYTYLEFVQQEVLLMDYFLQDDVWRNDDSILESSLYKRIETKRKFYHLIKLGEKYNEIKKEIGFQQTIACMTSYFAADLDFAERFVNGAVSPVNATSKAEKIALYYPTFWNGGAERVISELLRLYQRDNRNVIFISNQGVLNKDEYDVPNEIKRIYIPSWSKNPYEWIVEMIGIIRDYDIDVLCSHATSSLENYYLGLLLREMQIRFLITVHNHYEMYFDYQPDIKQLTKQLSYADELVVMSRDDSKYWNDVGIKSRYIPNPVCTKTKEISKERKGNQVLWIGRITNTVKNVFDVVEIMDFVHKKLPDIRLKVVGRDYDGKSTSELKRRVTEAQLQDVIDICGFDKNVDRYYEEADVMILTSSFECFPMVVVEGKSYGVPLVLYELPYLELLKDGKGYKAVPQEDKVTMANVLVDLFTDDEKRKKLSKEARESLDPFLKIDLVQEWEKAFKGIEG